MKFITCDLCNTTLALGEETSVCACGNIRGRMADKVIAAVYVKNRNVCRVFGIEDAVIHGAAKKGSSFIIPWRSKNLIVHKFVPETPLAKEELKLRGKKS